VPNKLSFQKQFTVLLQAGAPIVSVATHETFRCIDALSQLTALWNKKLAGMTLPKGSRSLKKDGYCFKQWDIVNGWRNGNNLGELAEPDTGQSPINGLNYLVDADKPGVYIMQNLHLHYGKGEDLPTLIQLLHEQFVRGKMNRVHLFLISPTHTVPLEVQPLIATMSFPLATRATIVKRIAAYISGQGFDIPPGKIEAAAEAATGMPLLEVDAAVATALVISGGVDLDRDVIFQAKADVVRRSGLLEHLPSSTGIDQVGGLDNYKRWIKTVARAFRDPQAARAYGLHVPNSCLVLGVPGAGKTLAAKATASVFGVPLFRLNIGNLLGPMVGESEENTREVFSLMSAVSPCIVLLDEAERALAGSATDAHDTGVGSRMMSELLWWLEENTSPVFLVLTANEITNLPSPLLRRMDEIWYVDLPTRSERESILRIKLEGAGRNVTNFPGYESLAAEHMAGFTGSEVEDVVHRAMSLAFAKKREFTIADLANAARHTTPVSITKKEEIDALRAWAVGRAKPANQKEGAHESV
jgi:AAA+ superfamily predicted ATPase